MEKDYNYLCTVCGKATIDGVDQKLRIAHKSDEQSAISSLKQITRYLFEGEDDFAVKFRNSHFITITISDGDSNQVEFLPNSNN